MEKKIKRFWYLLDLDFQGFITRGQRREMFDLYDEIYDELSDSDLRDIEMVWG